MFAIEKQKPMPAEKSDSSADKPQQSNPQTAQFDTASKASSPDEVKHVST